jgi:hypothetical protein
MSLSKVMFAWVAGLLRTWEIQGTYLGQETGYLEVFRDFRQSFQENSGIVSQVRSRPLPPCHLKFISPPSSYHSTLYVRATDNVVKEHTRN